jgi:hypothetical protein
VTYLLELWARTRCYLPCLLHFLPNNMRHSAPTIPSLSERRRLLSTRLRAQPSHPHQRQLLAARLMPKEGQKTLAHSISSPLPTSQDDLRRREMYVL